MYGAAVVAMRGNVRKAYEKGCSIRLVGLADENKPLVEPMPAPLNKICVVNALNAVELKRKLQSK